MFYVLYPFVTYLLTFPLMYLKEVELIILVAPKSSGELMGGYLQLRSC
jgi:hypothetical protein